MVLTPVSARHPLTRWLLLLSLVAMWGSSFLAIKVAVTAIPPATLVAARLAIATAILIGLVVALRRPRPGGRAFWRSALAMGLIGNALPFFLIAWGQRRIDSGLAGILMAVMPLLTLVLAHLFVAGERLNRRRILGFLLGFAGIVVLFAPEIAIDRAASEALAAKLAVLAGAFCYAVNTILARHRPASDALSAAAAVTLAASLMMAPLAWAEGGTEVRALGLEAVLAVLFLSVVSTALATVVYFRLITLAGPTFLSLINYLIPLWAVGLGMLALKEQPPARAIISLVMVLAGIAIAAGRPLNR